jgi:hypothetical protein
VIGEGRALGSPHPQLMREKRCRHGIELAPCAIIAVILCRQIHVAKKMRIVSQNNYPERIPLGLRLSMRMPDPA